MKRVVILFFIILFNNNIYSIFTTPAPENQAFDITNLEQFNIAIAKSLAKNISLSDEKIAYIQFNRDLAKFLDQIKQEVFGTNQLNSRQEMFLKSVREKINETQFDQVLNLYREKNKQIQDLVKIYESSKSADDLQKIEEKLNELFSQISSIINIPKNILFEEFEKANLFKDIQEIKEIKDFINNEKSQSKASDETISSSETKAVEILGVSIVVAGILGITYKTIKNFLARRAGSKIKVDLNNFDETTYQDIQKNFDNALKSKDIKSINDAIDKLVEKMRLISNKDIFPKDLAETISKTESLAKELGQELINKLRISYGLAIEKNSPLFEAIFGSDNTIGKIREGEYIEALRAHDVQKLVEIAEKIKVQLKGKQPDVNESDVLKLLYDHDSDLRSLFKEKNSEFIQHKVDFSKAKEITLPTISPKKFSIQELGTRLNLKPTQIEGLTKFLREGAHSGYIKIGENVYEYNPFTKNLTELHKPTIEIQRKAYEYHPVV